MNLRNAKRSEDTEQIKLMNWCKINESRYPELRWCFHIPNGGKRNKQEAEKFKQMGVKAGVADIQLPFQRGIYNGMFIELKYEDNKPTKNQIEFMQAMQAAGHYCCVCYSSYAAIRTIEGYLNLTDGAEMTDAYIDDIEPLVYQIHKTWGIPIIMDSWRR